MIKPVVEKLDSLLGQIGRENGFIFIINTDNRDFPFIHLQAGKDLTEIVIARINGQVLPVNEENKTPEGGASATQKEEKAVPAPEQQPAEPAK